MKSKVEEFLEQKYPTALNVIKRGAEVATVDDQDILSRSMRLMVDEATTGERRGFDQVADDAWREMSNCLDTIYERTANHDGPVNDYGARNNPGQGPGRLSLLPTQRRSGDVWVDREGREIRALKPTDSFAAATRDSYAEQTYGDMTFGGFVRSLVLGPKTDAERRALAEGTPSAGGYTVPAPLASQVIDLMRAKSVVMQSGAVTVPMGSQTLSIAKLATDPTAAWHVENAAVSTSDPTFSNVLLTAQTLISMVKVSMELAEDSINLGAALQAAFAGSLANEVDRVALAGSGSGAEPEGIRNASGVNEVDHGGAALTNYDDILTLVQALANANSAPPTALILSPREYFKIQGFTDSQNRWLAPPPVIDPFLADAGVTTAPKWLHTTGVSITETHTGPSPDATNSATIYCGDFKQMLIGVRSDLRIEVLKETYAANHQFAFRAFLRTDIALAQPGAFGRLIGVTP